MTTTLIGRAQYKQIKLYTVCDVFKLDACHLHQNPETKVSPQPIFSVDQDSLEEGVTYGGGGTNLRF